jgi:hypothetical protein
LRSILTNSPDAVLEKVRGLTVLHLSSTWPAGLSILLSTQASEFINVYSLSWNSMGTPLDFAVHFGCNEAVSILLDNNGLWNSFPYGNSETSLECVSHLASALASRRRNLLKIAEDVATIDLSGYINESTRCVPDSGAAALVTAIQAAAVQVPEHLSIPLDYEGIYLSGNLSIEHFPIFFEAGFHDIHKRSIRGLLPICVADLGGNVKGDKGDPRISLLSPRALKWLQDQGCMENSLTDPLLHGWNTLATGWHLLAVRLAGEMGFKRAISSHPSVEFGLACQLLCKIFASRSFDGCKCWCSTNGCLPLHAYCKEGIGRCCGHIRVLSVMKEPGCNFSTELSGEILRLLTFEGLDMTHTCCSARRVDVTRPDFWAPVTLYKFGGDTDAIQNEEVEMAERLETLVSEFQVKFIESGQSLLQFVWGYWRKRMGEECIPGDINRNELRAIGITVDKSCKSTDLMLLSFVLVRTLRF